VIRAFGRQNTGKSLIPNRNGLTGSGDTKSTAQERGDPVMARNVALYLQAGTNMDVNWADASPPVQQQMERAIQQTLDGTLRPMAFNVYIIAFLHVHPTPGGGIQLIYNDNPVSKIFPRLSIYLSALRARGTRLLISIGGWNNPRDFATIQQYGVDRFLTVLKEQVIVPWGLDGIDLDLEPSASGPDSDWDTIYQKYKTTLVELSNQGAAKGLLVTHAPIPSIATDHYFSDILTQTRRNPGGNSVSWLNVQSYGEGSEMSDNYRNLVTLLAAQRAKTGIPDAAGFLNAGFGIADDLNDDRSVAVEQIRDIRRKGQNPGGAFIWRYNGNVSMLTGWAVGLAQALDGPTERVAAEESGALAFANG
jgi:hypothetical protein